VLLSAVYCQTCPPGCSVCKAIQPLVSSTASVVINCTLCSSGFSYSASAQTCVPACAANAYYNSTLQACATCAAACLNCVGGSAYNCLQCAHGFALNTSGACAIQQMSIGNVSTLLPQNCGIGGYYDAIVGNCACQDPTQFFNRTA
jgi:hypothetical protein